MRACVLFLSKRGTLRPLGAGCDRCDAQERRFTVLDNEVHASKRSMRTRVRDFAFVRQPEQSVRGRKAITVYPYKLDA